MPGLETTALKSRSQARQIKNSRAGFRSVNRVLEARAARTRRTPKALVFTWAGLDLEWLVILV